MPVVMRLFVAGRYQVASSIVVLAVFLGAIAGCQENRGIVGKWRLAGGAGETVWQFSRNGSVLIGNVQGRYRFGDQGRIKIETPFATSVYVFEISSDRMILREPNGPKLEFTRIRGENGER
jgi:hypothetical protein